MTDPVAPVGALPAAATWGRLQTFLAVHDSGSVRSAAEALHVTPPAISAALSALEAGLGTKLFTRAGRGIVPTDAGETFAGYARRLLGLLEEAAGAVHDADRGRVRIGAVTSAAEYVLPHLIASYAAAHPHVELSVSVLPRDELFALAADHAIDVVLAGRPPSGSGLVTRATHANQLFVVGRPGIQEDPLTLPWLLTAQGTGTRDTALSLLTRLQASPPLLTLGTAGAAVAAAREGLGVTLVHAATAREPLAAGDLATYDVAGTPLDRPWHLSTGTEPTAATRLFLRHVCDPDLVGAAAFHTRSRPQG